MVVMVTTIMNTSQRRSKFRYVMTAAHFGLLLIVMMYPFTLDGHRENYDG